jgi:hypothetical protein
LSRPFRNRSWLCFSFRTTFRLLLWTSHLSKTRLPERDPQLLQGPRKVARESKYCTKKQLWLQNKLLFYQTLYSNQIKPQEKRKKKHHPRTIPGKKTPQKLKTKKSQNTRRGIF